MKRDLEKSGKQRGMFDPFRDFFEFDNFLPTWGGRGANAMPAVNVAEDDKSYTVDVVAPGFKKEDFHVDVDNDMLTISAEHKSEPTDRGSDNRQYTRREYSYSSFTRSFRLPDNAKDENISARYEDGVLKLEIPKSEQQSRSTKEIPIR